MLKKILKFMSLILMAGLVVFVSCDDKDDEPETPPVVILDGLYVTGVATPYSGLDSKGLMQVARNEVTQEERTSLYELYLPLKAGQEFNIVKVAGSVQTYYAPGAGWGIVAEPTTDEPKDAPILRGSVEESNATFTVDADGLYHVAMDTELEIAVICQVHWGVIGDATPDGWNGSTVLPDITGYNPNNMTWEINDMELRGGTYKFRYSNGWKIELDTTLDIGNGDKGVKVNTNFGGTLNALLAGGENITNDDPGIFTIVMDYTTGEGFTATATKTGDLNLTNWTGVACDAVGDGVSADNPAAIPDPSGWGWGNKLLADNGAIPTVDGDVYTWTWTGIILEADAGFKIRTENGEAPPVGGSVFDAGWTSLDVDASSANVYSPNENDLMVSVKATYNITLIIDAADNDSKTIIITEQ